MGQEEKERAYVITLRGKEEMLSVSVRSCFLFLDSRLLCDRRRGISRNAGLLALPLVLRTRQVRTPRLFGRRLGLVRYIGFECSRVRLCLHELADHHLNGCAKQLRSQNRHIEKKALLFLPGAGQVRPQVPLRGQHFHHRSTNCGSSLLSGPESQICGAAQLGNRFRGKTLTLVHCRVCPAIQMRCCRKGLGWQGRSFQSRYSPSEG